MASKNRMERYVSEYTMPMHRSGWRGVLDAIRAAATGEPRLAVAVPVVVSFWASAPVGVRLETRINRVSVEPRFQP